MGWRCTSNQRIVADGRTVCVRCVVPPGPSLCHLVVHSMNSSHNGPTSYGSGFDDATHCGVSMEFCSFRSNRKRNCLAVGYLFGGGSSTHSHLSFVSNSCVSSSTWPGLLCTVKSCPCSASLFRGNSVDFLVGGSYDSSSVTVTLSGCVFDSEPFASKCTFVTNGCTVDPSATVWWTVGLLQCSLTPTPTSSQTPSSTRRPRTDPSGENWAADPSYSSTPHEEVHSMAGFESPVHFVG